MGHNSSLAFLVNLWQVGNTSVEQNYDLDNATYIAREMHKINYNTDFIPRDCPLYGENAFALVNNAFRNNRGGLFHIPPSVSRGWVG